MLVAFAAVWFIVFLPSVGKKNRDKDASSKARREQREALTANSSPVIAGKVSKAKTAERVLLALTTAAILATLVAVFQGSTLGAVVGVAAIATFAVLSRVAHSKISNALKTGSRRRAKLAPGLTDGSRPSADVDNFVEDKTWNPTALPQQVYQSKVGTLDTPTLAEVVKLEIPQVLESETLDEILRRRRAN
jgi:hypothetical protein